MSTSSRTRLRLRISIRETEPEIWRTLDVDGALRLDELHEAVQIAFGWHNSHLHQFSEDHPFERLQEIPRIGRAPRHWTMHDSFDDDESGLDERATTIAQVFDDLAGPLYYWYDFGDDWLHTIELIEREPAPASEPRATVVAGERRGPLDDSGGPHGYAELVEILADPGHPEHDLRLGWASWMVGPWAMFNAEDFDRDAVNWVLAQYLDPSTSNSESGQTDAGAPAIAADSPLGQLLERLPPVFRPQLLGRLQNIGAFALVDIDVATAARMVEPYRWLVRRCGDEGIRLTKAGYLPPVVVHDAMHELGWTDRWFGQMNREDQTRPVWNLREGARRFGLVRKYKGALLATAAARRLVDSPLELCNYLAARLTARTGAERDAVLLFAIEVAGGNANGWLDPEPILHGLEALGWVQHDGRPLTDEDARDLLRDTWHTLDNLGAFERIGRRRSESATSEGRAFAVAMLQASCFRSDYGTA